MEFLDFLSDNLMMIYILIFASFLGFELISNVSAVLHTPLMSGSNAISGIVIIGAILLLRESANDNYFAISIGTIGVFLASINVVGGFAVTHRMLKMFSKKKENK